MRILNRLTEVAALATLVLLGPPDTLGAQTLTFSPSPVVFSISGPGASGGPITVTASSTGVPVSAVCPCSIITQSGSGNWLKTRGATTGNTFTVSVSDTSQLLANTDYTGSIFVNANDNAMGSLQVTLHVGDSGTGGGGLQSNPASVSFVQSAPGAGASQNVSLTFNGAFVPVTTFNFAPNVGGVTFVNIQNNSGILNLAVNNAATTAGFYTGTLTVGSQGFGSVNFPVSLSIGGGTIAPSKIGAFNPSQAAWLLDSNGSFAWDGSPTDFYSVWGSANNVPVVGDWNGSGTKKIGVFNLTNGIWLLDMNGNGLWDGPSLDKQVSWGSPGDTPVVGNWNGSGTADKIGTFDPNQGTWLLDFNGNFAWDGAGTDKFVAWGSPGDKPMVGDWNGGGATKIGIFNPTQGWWLLDYNGNYLWEGAAVDRFLRWGSPGDTPVVGDWNASGTTKIGVFNSSQAVWLLDYNGNYTWDGMGADRFLSWGSPGDIPIVGDWNASGTTKIAVFNPSQGWWVIDYNGNYVWEGAVTDRFLRWGSPGDKPLVGKW